MRGELAVLVGGFGLFVGVQGFGGWVERIAWDTDETVLVYFRGTGLSELTEGLTARRRPVFAHGGEPEPGSWGVVVHPPANPRLDDYGPIDYRPLCPPGTELVVFVPNPCLAKAHGPKAYHFKDGEQLSYVDYENPEDVRGGRPDELASVIRAAGPDREGDGYKQRLTRLLCDHLGLPELDRASIVVDRALLASYD